MLLPPLRRYRRRAAVDRMKAADTSRVLISVFPSATRQTSVQVPPMSKVITFAIGQAAGMQRR